MAAVPVQLPGQHAPPRRTVRHVVDCRRRREIPLSHHRTSRVKPPLLCLCMRGHGAPLPHEGDWDDGARAGRVARVPVFGRRDGREGSVGVEGRHPGI